MDARVDGKERCKSSILNLQNIKHMRPHIPETPKQSQYLSKTETE